MSESQVPRFTSWKEEEEEKKSSTLLAILFLLILFFSFIPFTWLFSSLWAGAFLGLCVWCTICFVERTIESPLLGRKEKVQARTLFLFLSILQYVWTTSHKVCVYFTRLVTLVRVFTRSNLKVRSLRCTLVPPRTSLWKKTHDSSALLSLTTQVQCLTAQFTGNSRHCYAIQVVKELKNTLTRRVSKERYEVNVLLFCSLHVHRELLCYLMSQTS